VGGATSSEGFLVHLRWSSSKQQ